MRVPISISSISPIFKYPGRLSTDAVFAKDLSIEIHPRGSEATADVYDAETGGSIVEQPLITDRAGEILGADGEECWIEEDSYDILIDGTAYPWEPGRRTLGAMEDVDLSEASAGDFLLLDEAGSGLVASAVDVMTQAELDAKFEGDVLKDASLPSSVVTDSDIGVANGVVGFDSEKHIEGGDGIVFGSGASEWQVGARTTFSTFAVPLFKPTGENANIAWDIAPSGLSPTNYANNGLAWLDLCSLDPDLAFEEGGLEFYSARVGVREGHVEFGARSFNGYGDVPVHIAVGGTEVLVVEKTTAKFSHDQNSAYRLWVENPNASSLAEAELAVVSDTAAINLEAFSSTFGSGQANLGRLRATGTGGLALVADKTNAPILFVTGSTVLSTNTRAKIDTKGNIFLGKGSALATNATDGFVSIASGEGAPTGTPTLLTGAVPLYVNTSGGAGTYLYAYIKGAWKALA
jgi:hypothetical protein